MIWKRNVHLWSLSISVISFLVPFQNFNSILHLHYFSTLLQWYLWIVGGLGSLIYRISSILVSFHIIFFSKFWFRPGFVPFRKVCVILCCGWQCFVAEDLISAQPPSLLNPNDAQHPTHRSQPYLIFTLV